MEFLPISSVFCLVELILLSAIRLHPIHVELLNGGKVSQLNSVVGMHEAGFLRYR